MVEQGTHKPLVGSSILPSGTTFHGPCCDMFTVYLLRGANGRHYLGQTTDLDARLAQHRRGHTYTTRRLGGELTLVAHRAFPSRSEAVRVERLLKNWKNPVKAAEYLRRVSE